MLNPQNHRESRRLAGLHPTTAPFDNPDSFQDHVETHTNLPVSSVPASQETNANTDNTSSDSAARKTNAVFINTPAVSHPNMTNTTGKQSMNTSAIKMSQPKESSSSAFQPQTEYSKTYHPYVP